VPPHLLSRVSAYDWIGSLALAPLGLPARGPAREALGATEVLVVGAAAGALVLAAGLLVPRDSETSAKWGQILQSSIPADQREPAAWMLDCKI
jgi:hypothetical protein